MKTNKFLWIFLPLLALTLLVALNSCKTARQENDLGPHPEGWMDPNSPNFHGFPAERDSNNCRSCHGQDLHGSPTAVSCYQCHVSYPHPAQWMDTTSTQFHGMIAKTDSGKGCTSCHGADFNGGISNVSCRNCHASYPHINFANWQQPIAADSGFHGWQAMSDTAGPGVSCQPCHGENFNGTSRARACYDCHTMLHVNVENEDTVTHREFVAAKSWQIKRTCAVCHDSTFTGGRAATVDDAAVCTQCHVATVDTMNLNGCNVCHTDDPALRPYWKVPFGMQPGAEGAHPMHVAKNDYSCRECHPSLSSSGHPHALPADVAFVEGRTRFSTLFGFQPAYTHVGAPNSGNASCSNVYCHSNGLPPNPGPPTTNPPWVGGHVTCTSCHGFPPPTSVDPNHPQNRTCHACHSNVDPTSNYNYPVPDSVRFIVDSLHVNGQITF